MAIRSLQDLLNAQEDEEAMMTPMEISPLRSNMSEIPPAQPDMQQPIIPDDTPQEQVFNTPQLSDIIPPNQEPQVPMMADAGITPPAPEIPLSKSEQLIQEYQKMLGRDQESLEEARSSDRMLKVGGALGDALATYLNAKGQMNVKAPGVQVQQGAGLGKIADMFATAPEIASDVKGRREAMLKQYAELAKGERSQARLESEEKRAGTADKRARELAKMQIEGNLKAAGIKAGAKPEFTPYQEKMLGEKQEENVRKLSSDISKSGLPRLTTSIKELERQLGMPLEEALALNTDEDETNDVNIPGYGRLASLAPDWSVKEKQRAFRQGVQAVLNPDISKQYGATQSAGEIQRYQKQIGGGNFENQNAVLRGLVGIKTAAQSDLSAIQAGYDPKIVEKYQERKGVTLDVNKKEEAFPKVVTNKKTKETATVENEKELKEALAEGFE